MTRCKSCQKVIGIEVEIHKRTYGYSQTTYQNVTGVYKTPSGRKMLDVEDLYSDYIDAETTYECDFCGHVYSEKEVIAIMEELAELDKEKS